MRRFRMMGIALGVSLAAAALLASTASAQPEPEFYDGITGTVIPLGAPIAFYTPNATLVTTYPKPASITCSSSELDATLVKNGAPSDDDSALLGAGPLLGDAFGGTDGQLTALYIIKGGHFSGCQASTPQGSAPVTVDLPPDPCFAHCTVFRIGAFTSDGSNLVVGLSFEYNPSGGCQCNCKVCAITYQAALTRSTFNTDGAPLTVSTTNQPFILLRPHPCEKVACLVANAANLSASWSVVTATGDPITYGPPVTTPCIDCAPPE